MFEDKQRPVDFIVVGPFEEDEKKITGLLVAINQYLICRVNPSNQDSYINSLGAHAQRGLRSVCLSISPLERLFVLKSISCTQRATKVKILWGFL